ncbi:GNAT family N-acetyltransferase [Micromonospora citrea]|uniref:GNAT family N-acetyltransferase n=1 Tax=Micromonospora citrea TaxID=47855 RepID=UPI003C599956
MRHDEVPEASTLLLRTHEPGQAAAALGMLDRCLGGIRPIPPTGVRVVTLSDVSSDGSQAPAAACLLIHRLGEPSAWVPAFAVDVPFRRRGLGRRLLADLCRALRADGARELFVRITGDCPGPATWLAAHGFTAATGPPPGRHNIAATRQDGSLRHWLVSEL